MKLSRLEKERIRDELMEIVEGMAYLQSKQSINDSIRQLESEVLTLGGPEDLDGLFLKISYSVTVDATLIRAIIGKLRKELEQEAAPYLKDWE